MRIVIQRVNGCSVTIEGEITAEIGKGMLILVGIEDSDSPDDVEYLTKKAANLRIFDDENGVMNRSVMETEGEMMIISQFTLMASTKKGNRPSYIKASKPDTASPLYTLFCHTMETIMGRKVSTGQFGADMKVSLTNDGPVTIMIDSKNKE